MVRLVDGQQETVVDTALDAFNARLLVILPSAQSCIFRAGNSNAGRSVLRHEQYEASYDGEHGQYEKLAVL